MKKLIYLFLTVLIVACSSDDGNSNETPQVPQNFYEAHKFHQISEAYLEDNIPHIAMLKSN